MNSTFLCYKDGPDLPPLNFTPTCITSGRYVTFYNEQISGVNYPAGYELNAVFTELCEVIVQGRKTNKRNFIIIFHIHEYQIEQKFSILKLKFNNSEYAEQFVLLMVFQI